MTNEARKKVPAKRKAGNTPPKENSVRQSRLQDLIALVETTSKKKGWDVWLVSVDEETWQYATMAVSRTAPSTFHEITATIEIACGEKVSIATHGTSFYSYGLSDLRAAIGIEFGKLTWLQQESGKPDKTSSIDEIDLLRRFLRRFRQFARQLQHRHNDRPAITISDEYDVQDILHAILRGLFADVRTEEYVPSYAGSAARVDFLLKAEKVALEVKFSSQTLKDKQIGEQLLIDIARYQAHPDCQKLICFVYDPNGNIRNPDGLEADLSKTHDKLSVSVIVSSA